MTIYALGDKTPDIHSDTWVAPDANLIGLVVLEEGASVWFGSTIRADHEEIRIGAGSNVQENVVMHIDAGFPLTIGRDCTIGHKVMLHGCTIGDNSLIGMGATVLNGARIGRNCLIGADLRVQSKKNPIHPQSSSTARAASALSASSSESFRYSRSPSGVSR